MHARRRKTPADVRVLALGVLLGIGAVYALPRLPALWMPLLGTPLLLIRGRQRAWLGAMLVGACAAISQAAPRLADRLPLSETPVDVTLAGEIAALPERKGADWRFVFAPAADAPRRIRLSWYRSDAELKGGQCWRFRLRLRSPHGLMNPGGFDYEGWLFREGIGATGYVRAAEPCTDPPVLNRPAHALLLMRQRIVDAVSARLGEHPMRGFILGLTVGDDSGVSDGQWRVMRRTGTTHLISISGLHITLAAGFVFFILRWGWAMVPAMCLRLPAQRAGAVGAMLAALCYSMLAGFSIPTQRSLLMLLVLMGALLLSRQMAPSRLLALALLVVLLLDPAGVLDPGFWLSFGAVGWMLYGLTARLRPASRLRTWLQPQWVLALALVPPCLFWFGESSLVSPVANALMIPLFSLLIPWLLLAVLALGSSLGEWLLMSGAEALQWLWLALAWAAKVPQAYWTWTPPALPALCVATLGLLLALAPRGAPARMLGLVLCVPVLFGGSAPPPAGSFDVALLDVGQGLSAVVRTQAHSLLFDAGPAQEGGLDSGETVVLPFLRQQGIRRLDRLVLSHDHLDHSGGIQAVREGMPVVEETGTDRGAPCRAGQRWSWDGVDFEFLHPGDEPWSINDVSCVLRVSAGTHAVLLTGDIEAAAEAHLVDTRADWLAAEVVIVAHHGSATSSTPRFVRAVNADYALVPAGWANRWRFPKERVVERWRESGAQVEVTGRGGALLLRMSPGRGVEALKRWREQSPRFWRAGSVGQSSLSCCEPERGAACGSCFRRAAG